MNHEMMLYQARQDFIDLHQDLIKGKKITLEHYDTITKELQAIDELNFELMLDTVTKTEGFNIRQMWQSISNYLQQIKTSGQWSQRKLEYLTWNHEFSLLASETNHDESLR